MALNYQTNDPSSGSGFNWGSLISPTVGAVGSYLGGQQLKSGINSANNQQQQVYNQVAGIYQPQYAAGTGADKSLASALGLNGAAPNYAAFENSPGYQFTLQQGDQAINRAAAASGNAFSSSTLAALDKYNTGLAQQNYQNYVGNLLSTAGLGNQAAAGMAAARYNTGANIGQGLANIGAANSSAVQGIAQGFAQPLGNLFNQGANYFGSGIGDTSGFTGDAFNSAFDSSGLNDISSLGGDLGFNAAGGEAAGSGVEAGLQGYANQGIANLGGSGASAAGGIGLANGLGALGGALGTYNFAKNWQSGSTGSDALAGAGAGAGWGTMIAPGIGTIAGALIGGAVGAASSAFGPGKMDAENTNWNSYASAYDKNPGSVSGATPAQNFQVLSGIFDSRGSNIPFYSKYGRQGENQFTGDLFKQVNSAITAGKISSGASPQQIYSQVVQPWINGMSSGGWQNTFTSGGASEKNAVGNVLTNLIGQWQSGQINSGTQLGIGGQTLQGGVPVYGA